MHVAPLHMHACIMLHQAWRVPCPQAPTRVTSVLVLVQVSACQYMSKHMKKQALAEDSSS